MTDEEEDLWTPPTAYEWIQEVKDVPPWVIPDWIPERGIVLMSGHQKVTRKTWMAMLQALTIASGKQVGPFKSDRQGTVLFVEEEGTEADTRYRLIGLCQTYKLPLKKTLSQIHFVFRQGVGLDVPRWREDLVSYVERFSPAAAFFDNLTFLHSGDENRGADMRPVLDTIKEVRNAGTACIFLAHLNAKHGGDPRANHDRQVRGHTSITNSYDVHIALRNYDDESVPIEAHNYFRGQQAQKFMVRWHVESTGIVVHKAELQLDPWYDQDDPRFAEMCLERMEVEEEYTLPELTKLWRINRKKAATIVAELKEQGRIDRGRSGHYQLV